MCVTKVFVCVLVFCCFKDVISGRIRSRSTYQTKKDAIENHPNVGLLPEICGEIKFAAVVFGGMPTKRYDYPWMALISFSDRIINEPTTTAITNPELKTRFSNDDSKFLGIVLRSRTKRYADAVGESGDLLTFKCGGSIINSRYILTAAHCVIRDQEHIGVRIGEYDYSEKEQCQGEGEDKICTHEYQDVEVEEIIPHKGFLESNTDSHDIALLRTKKPMNITLDNISPICLPVSKELRELSLQDQIAQVAGWGSTEYDTSSPVLMKVNIPIRPCNKKESEGVLCAGEDKKDSCSGDSGGPLMVTGPYGEYFRQIVYGIVSNGPKQCGSKDKYGVYTDVTKYVDWILDNIKP